MTVGVVRAGRRDGHPRCDGRHERLGRGRAAAVVGDLEQIDLRQSDRQQAWIDPILHVAGQEEAA
jgi:hypothetical protein